MCTTNNGNPAFIHFTGHECRCAKGSKVGAIISDPITIITTILWENTMDTGISMPGFFATRYNKEKKRPTISELGERG